MIFSSPPWLFSLGSAHICVTALSIVLGKFHIYLSLFGSHSVERTVWFASLHPSQCLAYTAHAQESFRGFPVKCFYMKLWDTFNLSSQNCFKGFRDYFEVPVWQMPCSSFSRSQQNGLCIRTFSSWEFCLIIDYFREFNSTTVTGRNEWLVLFRCLIYEEWPHYSFIYYRIITIWYLIINIHLRVLIFRYLGGFHTTDAGFLTYAI